MNPYKMYDVLNRLTGRYVYTGPYATWEVEEIVAKKYVILVDVETGEVLW